MISPSNHEDGPCRPASPRASAVREDRWLCAALLATAAVYVALVFLRPTGENWGRGWNMIAFLLYAAPSAVVAGAVACWRLKKTTGQARNVAVFVAWSAFLFPIVCAVTIRLKA